MPASVKRKVGTSHKLIGILAAKDLWHDWRTTGVLLCVVVSIVTPLLILLGLKQGVINTQRQLLLNDPCNLEIKMQGNGYNLPPSWFEDKAKDTRIQFIIPVTRFLNNDIGVLDSQNNIESVDLIATAAGDPLLKMAGLDAPVNDREILVTHALAQRLHLQQNGELHTLLSRTINHEQQQANTTLNIKAVLPEYGCLQRSAVLTTLSFLLAVEDYKQGLNIALFQPQDKVDESKMPDAEQNPEMRVPSMLRWDQHEDNLLSYQKPFMPNFWEHEVFRDFLVEHANHPPFYDSMRPFDSDKMEAADTPQPEPVVNKRASYARARIFAKTLDDVPKLADELRSGKEGMEIISKVYEIEKLRQLDRFLNVLLLIVSVIGMVGGGFALGGNFLLSIDGKRGQIAQMRLLGLSKRQIAFFLGIQGLLITSCAFIVNIILALISQFIAELYGKEILGAMIETGITEIRIFCLDGFDYLLAYLVTLMFTGLVIVVATRQANKIHPGEQLREF